MKTKHMSIRYSIPGQSWRARQQGIQNNALSSRLNNNRCCLVLDVVSTPAVASCRQAGRVKEECVWVGGGVCRRFRRRFCECPGIATFGSTNAPLLPVAVTDAARVVQVYCWMGFALIETLENALLEKVKHKCLWN